MGEGKIPEDDKTTATTVIDEAVEWLNANPAAELEEFESKKKEVEGKLMPIMQKIYQSAAGSGGMPGGMPGGMLGGFPGGMPGGMPTGSAAPQEDDGPSIEEVD